MSNGCCTSTNRHQVIRERWVGSKKKPSHNKGRKISKQITTAKTVSSTGLNGKKNALHSLYFLQAHIVQFKVSQHANHSFVVYPIHYQNCQVSCKDIKESSCPVFCQLRWCSARFFGVKKSSTDFCKPACQNHSFKYYLGFMGARVSWLTFHSVFRESCLHVRLSWQQTTQCDIYSF